MRIAQDMQDSYCTEICDIFSSWQMALYLTWLNAVMVITDPENAPNESEEELLETVESIFGQIDWDEDDFIAESEFSDRALYLPKYFRNPDHPQFGDQLKQSNSGKQEL